MEGIIEVDLHEMNPYWQRAIPAPLMRLTPDRALKQRNLQARRFARHRGQHPSIIGDDGVSQQDGPDVPVPPPSMSPFQIVNLWRPKDPDNYYGGRPDALEPLKSVVTFIKAIGKGGQGVIALCDFPTSKDQNGRPVRRVVKMAKGEQSQAVGHEVFLMEVRQRRGHIWPGTRRISLTR